MDPVEGCVRAALERAGFVGADRLLVVAVSGGPDSLALLHALLSLRESSMLRLHVAHLNHDFRGEEAEEDARFVASLASRLGLPATVERVDPTDYQRKMKISSFEEAAREARYSFLTRVVRELSGTAIALGHTADDLAETVLMHIIRGSGVHGLRGMEELSPWQGRTRGPRVTLFRPLLEVTKDQTVAYCQKRGIAFREDSGNRQLRFTRNRVRHQLLPALRRHNPRIRDALVRLARSASLGVSYLEKELDEVWPTLARQEGDSIVLDAGLLASLHPFMRRMVLRRSYLELTGDTRKLEEAHLQAMDEFIGAPVGKMLALPKGLRLYAGYGQLVMGWTVGAPCPFPVMQDEHEVLLPSSAEERVTEVPGWHIGVHIFSSSTFEVRDPFATCFDAKAIGDRLWVRTRLPGDRFQPLGMGSEKKLQDFYVDEKVPRDWRDRVALVVSERGIAWVVGYRVAEWARVTPDSQRVCQIQFYPNS